MPTLVDRLYSALQALGADATSPWTGSQGEPNCIYVANATLGLVRVHFATAPTALQISQATTAVTSYDPAPTVAEQLDAGAIAFPPRVIAALVALSASTSTAPQKTRAQAIVDAAFARITGVA